MLKRLYRKEFIKKISFTEEKIFTVEEKFNHRYDSVCQSSYEAKGKVPGV